MEAPKTSKKRPIGFVTLEEKPSKPKTGKASKDYRRNQEFV